MECWRLTPARDRSCRVPLQHIASRRIGVCGSGGLATAAPRLTVAALLASRCAGGLVNYRFLLGRPVAKAGDPAVPRLLQEIPGDKMAAPPAACRWARRGVFAWVPTQRPDPPESVDGCTAEAAATGVDYLPTEHLQTAAARLCRVRRLLPTTTAALACRRRGQRTAGGLGGGVDSHAGCRSRYRRDRDHRCPPSWRVPLSRLPTPVGTSRSIPLPRPEPHFLPQGQR